MIRHTDADGVSTRKAVSGKTADEARQRAREILRRLNEGLPARDSGRLVEAFTEAWIDSTLAHSDRKGSTKSMYATVARKHIVGSKLGAMPLNKVQPSHVEGWLAGLRGKGLSDSTVRSAYTILRSIFEAAVRDEELAKSPVAVVKRPTVERVEAAYLSPAQVKTLLDAADRSRYRLVFELLVNTGLRRGEALALRWRDIDETRNLIRVRGTLARQDGDLVVTPTKTAKSKRAVHMTATAHAVIKAARVRQAEERLRAGTKWTDTGFVFTTETGEPCDPRNALRALKTAATKVQLDGVGLHTLRHSAASVMLNNNVPLKVVSEVLGHASISITGDIYGHVSPEVSASAMDALSDALA